MPVETLSVQREFEVARRILCASLPSLGEEDMPLPGESYLGMWGRDSAFMALAFHYLEMHEHAAHVLRCWSRFVWDADTKPSLVCLRHKGRENWTPGLAEQPSAEWLRARHGAFPTNVYLHHPDFPHGTMEVYGEEPDVDASALWLYALGEACTARDSAALAEELRPVWEATLAYLLSRRRADGLIPQRPNEDWADTLRRDGVVTYTQAALYAGLVAVTALYNLLGSREQTGKTEGAATIVRGSLSRLSAGKRKRPGEACEDLALLVVLDLAPDPAPILSALDRLATPHGRRIIEAPYPRHKLGPDIYPWGRYHNGGIWPWWMAVEALARARTGDRDTAIRLVRSAVRDGTVYEWLDAETGEGMHPEFVTGAAVLVWACCAGGLV